MYAAERLVISSWFGPLDMSPPASANLLNMEIAGKRYFDVKSVVRAANRPSKIGDDNWTRALDPSLTPTSTA
jgi:hypothetical protein